MGWITWVNAGISVSVQRSSGFPHECKRLDLTHHVDKLLPPVWCWPHHEVWRGVQTCQFQSPSTHLTCLVLAVGTYFNWLSSVKYFQFCIIFLILLIVLLFDCEIFCFLQMKIILTIEVAPSWHEILGSCQ